MRDRIEHQSAWKRADVERDTRWLHHLTHEQVEDFCKALEHAKQHGAGLFEMAPDDFPLGEAGQQALRAIIQDVLDGRGISVLRGFPVNRFSDDDMRLMYWGLGLRMGVPRPQGKQSQFMSNVTDTGGTYRSATGRGYNTNSALDFHADSCDMVGLMCLRTAKSGGTSMISSSVTAHNDMLRVRPDLVDILYQPFYFSRQGEQALEEPPYYQATVFGMRDGWFACRHVYNHIRGAQAGFPDLPRLASEQKEALDFLDAILAREDNRFEMHLEPGDLQFLNNHRILHSRTQYEDYEEPARRRHLLRLWLALPLAQPLPVQWREAYKDVDPATLRGGFRGVNITPEIEVFESRLAAWHGMACRIYQDKRAYEAAAQRGSRQFRA